MKRAAVVLVLMAVATPATASPLVDLDTGGMMFVGPTSAHPTAVYWNPAAAALYPGLHVWFTTSARFDYVSVDRATIDTGNGEPNENPVGTPAKRFDPVSATTFAPGSYLGLIYDFNNQKITGGIAFYTPYVDGSPEGQEELRYHTLGSDLRTVTGTVSVSYRPFRWLIFGAGVNLTLADMGLRFSLDEQLEGCAAAPCDVENPQFASDYDLYASTGLAPAIAFTFGTIYVPRQDLRLALVYHSSPGLGKLSLSGDVDVTLSPDQGGQLVHGDAQVYMELPQTLQAGFSLDVGPRLQLNGSITWMDLSVGSQLDLRMAGPELRAADVGEWVLRYRGLRDVFVFDFGIERPQDARLRLGLKLRLETGSTSTTHVSPQQIDAPSLHLLGGLQTGIGGGISLTLAVRAGVMLPTTVDDSAFSPSAMTSCVSSGHDLDRCEAAREGRAIPTAAGDYLHFNYGFMLGLAYDRL